jgi:large subunit ribosomal protein L1
MAYKSKRYRANKELVGERGAVPLDEALDVLQKTKKAKFDETVEVALLLGVDSKKSDQMVRGAVSLPRGIGKQLRVIVFCKEEKAKAAREAGAIEVGGEDLAAKIRDQNWLDFDVAIASPDMMGVVGKLGKILGPQGKMPSPKSGTVTANITDAVKEFRAGKIEFRADAAGNVHAPVGKASFEKAALKENIEAFLETIRGMKPASSKGKYIQKLCVTTTMGPGVHVEVD